jgi:hypothetical protein
MQPRFIDNRSNKEIDLKSFPFTIGREGCDWNIPTGGIAEKHVVIYEEGDKYFVEDKGSATGTYLNNRLLEKRMRLMDGANLKIGVTEKWPGGVKDLTFKFEEGDEDLEGIDILETLKENAKPSKILARHFIYHIVMKGLFARVAKGGVKRRIPIEKLAKSTFRFYSTHPYQVGEKLNVEMTHPHLEQKVIQFEVLVQAVNAPSNREYQVVDTAITKVEREAYQLLSQQVELDT